MFRRYQGDVEYRKQIHDTKSEDGTHGDNHAHFIGVKIPKCESNGAISNEGIQSQKKNQKPSRQIETCKSA